MAKQPLKAPMPYFGGKSKVAADVWARLGDVDNYVEPFMGSAAVLLLRPHPPRIETLNDLDCMVANFWRATQLAPEQVVEWCDWPVNEANLHANHRWLVLSDDAAAFRKRMRSDPDYFDPKIAGRWCWGICCWIGSGWCDSEKLERNKGARPAIAGSGGGGQGVVRTNGPAGGSGNRSPILGGGEGQLGHGIHAKGEGSAAWQQLPRLSTRDSDYAVPGGGNAPTDGNRPQLAETCANRRAWLLNWFGRLRDRLRTVRVCCGDWSRVCSSESVTTSLGTTGVFLDPPYGAKANRNSKLYSSDSLAVAAEVCKWCLEWGAKPGMRIALAGYAGEGHEILEKEGWEVQQWKANGGYGNASGKPNKNAAKERLWYSPGCVQAQQKSLFDTMESKELFA